MDVINKLWEFCNYLRHDGITYGDYIEQLTYLLFLKMADEKGRNVPVGCSWTNLIQYSGSELLEVYSRILQKLAKEEGILGDIFAQSLSKFSNPVNLKKLLNLIDGYNWSALGVEVNSAAYEGLLEKYAAEEKGAGQYFTPRTIINSIVRCIEPDFRKSSDYTIHDPACGTGGFLIGAFEWIMNVTDNGSKLSIKDRDRLVSKTFSGMDNVQSTRRLALMNCYLHNLEAHIYFGDALGDGPHVRKRYNTILTNPPFGLKGAGGAPPRDDFIVKTSNKQLNFVQHCITLLKSGGKAAIVVPDNVLFENSGKPIRKNLLNYCNLHTILRLPEGTFSPYSPGIKANVIFFVKGVSTKEVWIYDLRSGIENINKGNPLTVNLFSDFEKNYSAKSRKTNDRFHVFTKDEIEKREYNLDIFWITEKDPNADLPDPGHLANEIEMNLQRALSSVKEIISDLKYR